MKKFIKVDIQQSNPEDCEMLIAQLSEHDFYAFEQNENTLSAYISEEDFDEEILRSLLPALTSYTCSVIEDRNWNEEWEREFQPVTINNFAGIRASFHEPMKGVAHEIIITPKMSFGTGHHATTCLMVELMSYIDFKNKSVLDFGTGTGVLAILAEKLGASSVLAIDCDEWSINNAHENIHMNSCKKILIEKRDNILGIPVVDIILANITCNVLDENAENLLMKGSQLVLSGFLLNDEKKIDSAFVKNLFNKKHRLQRNEWLALRYENQ
jgi:ribosomal protein L11 methyltransferase